MFAKQTDALCAGLISSLFAQVTKLRCNCRRNVINFPVPSTNSQLVWVYAYKLESAIGASLFVWVSAYARA
jgi:hypothetical protein